MYEASLSQWEVLRLPASFAWITTNEHSHGSLTRCRKDTFCFIFQKWLHVIAHCRLPQTASAEEVAFCWLFKHTCLIRGKLRHYCYICSQRASPYRLVTVTTTHQCQYLHYYLLESCAPSQLLVSLLLPVLVCLH